MQKLWFTLLFCPLGFSGLAQKNIVTDSLKQALVVAREEKDKVTILCELSRKYTGIQTDSALLLAKQALDLSRNIDFKRGEAGALFHIGYSYRSLSDITISMRASLQGLQWAEQRGFRH